jgi:hypothetical protein
MSKPLSRVAIVVLIGLIIVVGVFATVQAASASSGQLKGRIDATAGDPYYASQQRGASQKLSPYRVENNKGGHGCESERVNPNDY